MFVRLALLQFIHISLSITVKMIKGKQTTVQRFLRTATLSRLFGFDFVLMFAPSHQPLALILHPPASVLCVCFFVSVMSVLAKTQHKVEDAFECLIGKLV